MSFPTIVSFFSGDKYYEDSANALRAQCDALELAHDIRPMPVADGEDWGDICRKKIPFYLDAFERSPTGILWVDVDTELLRRPDFVDGAKADMGAFLRAFKYVRDFDPVKWQRFFAPSFLYFGPTPTARAFLEHAAKLERGAAPIRATDDYFLQEAWASFKDQIHLDVWPPRFLMIDGAGDSEKAYFHFRSSGNVASFKGVMAQHEVSALAKPRQVAVLKSLMEAAKTRKAHDIEKMYQREIHRLDPTDQRAAIVVARVQKDPDRLVKIRRILYRASKDRTADQVAKRHWAGFEVDEGDLARGRQLCEALSRSETQADRDFSKSRLYRVGLEERGLAYAIEDRPKLWWMETPYPGNFGDILNPYLVEKLGGIPPRRAPAEEAILMIGSTIKFARAGTTVWGAGTPRMTDALSPDARYSAVRGPLTRELVLASGGTCPPVYGDCAWFLPQVYQPDSPIITHRYGLVRHLKHVATITNDAVRDISLSRIGDAEIEAFIEELHMCDRVLSTSLHGIITAHAYGIPALWCALADADAIPGDDTKFKDYFLSVGIEPYRPVTIDPRRPIDAQPAAGASWLPARQLDLQALAAVAPFPIVVPIRNLNLATV